MVSMLTRKCASIYNKLFSSRTFNLSIKSLTTVPNKDDEDSVSFLSKPPSDTENCSTPQISPFFSDFNQPSSSGFDIELVDSDAWGVSSGVAQAWLARDQATSGANSIVQQVSDDHEPLDGHSSHVEGEVDFEDLDNMRVRGSLFYKLERSSKEFEEYNLEFHRKKTSKKKEDKSEVNKAKTTPIPYVTSKEHKVPKIHELTRSKSVMPLMDEVEDVSPVNKRQRAPTFNQHTGPYHEPFCLDIYISKGSVRACVVHRVTSKVVAVAHSISKDMKFDLASTKNKTTCAAVGAILAQRALADDIHDVIYTPRKGERLEGKLQIVLQSIIDNGINVKVKLKQRLKNKKSFRHI